MKLQVFHFMKAESFIGQVLWYIVQSILCDRKIQNRTTQGIHQMV